MNATVIGLTERQLREKEFYEKFAGSFNPEKEINLAPVLSTEERPWNSYWSIFQESRDHFKPGARLLDFGSGPGDNALKFAHLGYKVSGFDIGEGNVKVAQELFAKQGTQYEGDFQVSAAESLPYSDASFDVIAGIDILHHVDIPAAIKECHRVLKSGGRAVFREPVEVPFLESIRNLALIKMIAPKEKSFDLHITEDERKLNQHDLAVIQSIFPKMQVKKYFFLARFDRFFRKGSDPRPSVLERIDHYLFALFPFLKMLGGAAVITLQKD